MYVYTYILFNIILNYTLFFKSKQLRKSARDLQIQTLWNASYARMPKILLMPEFPVHLQITTETRDLWAQIKSIMIKRI